MGDGGDRFYARQAVGARGQELREGAAIDARRMGEIGLVQFGACQDLAQTLLESRQDFAAVERWGRRRPGRWGGRRTRGHGGTRARW